MPDERSPEPDEARAALESVGKMQRAGERAGMPPLWLRAGFALLLGSYVTVRGMYTGPGVIAPLLGAFVAFLIIFGNPDSAMARARQNSSTLMRVVIILGFAAIVAGAAVGGAALRVKLGWSWAPPVLGVLVALGTFAFVQVRTRTLITKHRAGGAA